MPSILSERHFLAFGRIAYGYASVEVGIKICVAGILQVSAHNGFVVSAPYGAYQLASVAKSLASDNLKPELASKLRSIIDRWQTYTAMRTYVAHHRWRPGTRSGSVRPTFYEVKTGRAEVKGFDDNEKDYTPDELLEIAENIRQLNEEVKVFLTESGLEAIIERKSAEVSSAKDDGPGTA